MLRLAKIYRPITGEPLRRDSTYCEILPCEALRPYVRCFWGSDASLPAPEGKDSPSIVIPDTCMDIIFEIDSAHGVCRGSFCTVDESAYFLGTAENLQGKETFAIRFYAWAVALFSRESFMGKRNRAYAVDEFFGNLEEKLTPLLLHTSTMAERIEMVQTELLNRLETNRADSNLLNAIYYMLETDCRAKVSDICLYTAVSPRQLERIFNTQIGVSPKVFSSLVRYQLLWQELLFQGNTDILDAVEKYGFTDQSHLLRDFKKHHFMTPGEAVRYARKNK